MARGARKQFFAVLREHLARFLGRLAHLQHVAQFAEHHVLAVPALELVHRGEQLAVALFQRLLDLLALGDVARDHHHGGHLARGVPDHVALRLDVAQAAVGEQEPVVRALADAALDRLAEHLLHALAVVGVDLGEGIGARQVTVAEHLAVGRAVVEALAAGIQHRHQVRHVVEHQPQRVRAIDERLAFGVRRFPCRHRHLGGEEKSYP